MHDHQLTRLSYQPMSNRDVYVYQYVVAHRTKEDLEKFMSENILCSHCQEDLTREAIDETDWLPKNIWDTACLAEWDVEKVVDTESLL